MNEKYLVICNAHPSEYDSYYIKLSGCDSTSSSTIYSNSIIEGLRKNNLDFTVISAASVGHYPFTSKTKKLNDIEYCDNYFGVGYNNHILCSQQSKTKAIVKKFKQCHLPEKDELNIIVTDVHAPFLKAAFKIKKRYPTTKIVLICLDVPKFVQSTSKNLLLKLFKRLSVKQVSKLANKVDGYVFLSDYMKDVFGDKSKQSIVSPCILDTSIYDKAIQKNKASIDFVYCGVLSKQYNVDLLLEAFSLLKNPNYRLLLAGKGDYVESIKEKSISDKRIEYFGELPREEAYNLQKNASVLVNPRLPNSEYTKLSFPSKTVSYLYSGNPVVCYSLPSFPEKIKQVIVEPVDDTPESFSKAMEDAIGQVKKDQVNIALEYSEKNVVSRIAKLFKDVRKNG